ncbi:hypothetical protein H1P_4010009 [Hyella patelloides LEGE 07179]|uniref:Uncharacterized protein n=1 Tax=Hyella patelloides LEGE 07179 TaxID=945734 RepID=A0A563VXC4_9CYAN|nr:hypothetical protein H1P_4010009 [Hyella patelloides LEGE 07179]
MFDNLNPEKNPPYFPIYSSSLLNVTIESQTYPCKTLPSISASLS